MRILHVMSALNRGGAETWLLQILRHLDRRKYQIDFLVHTTEPGAFDEEVRALGARVIPCPKTASPLQYAFTFRRVMRDFGPYDCVHSHVHHFTGYVLMLAAMMRVPLRIAQSHSDTRSLDCNSRLKRRIYLSTMEALVRQFSSAGIAVSGQAGECLFPGTWGHDPRWRLCPLGIDFLPFAQAVDSLEVRSRLGIPKDAFVVGHVGRFIETKNHRFIVEIAERTCRLNPNSVFLLVGDGPLKTEIEDTVRKRGLTKHFVFAGVRSDVPRIMKGAMDCFLFPSIYEGLPLLLLEAQAAGLRCVVSATVSSEGDIGEAAVTRLSLDASADQWAAHLHRRGSSHDLVLIPREWRHARSIEASAASLEKLYEPALCRIETR